MSNKLKKVFFYGVAFNSIRMLVGAISAIYLVSQGLSVFDVGLVKTLQAMVILLLDIPLAFLSDLYSRKLSIVLATVCAAIWLILTGLANTPWVFYVAEAFNALSLALISGAFVSYLICVSQDTRTPHHQLIGKYQSYQFFSIDSILSSLIRLTLLVVLPLTSYWVQLKGWGALALVYAAVICIGFVCLKKLEADV